MRTASSAVGIAPASSMPGSIRSMPVKISSPRPPPPIRKASGTVPTLIGERGADAGEDHEGGVRQLDPEQDLACGSCPCRAPPRSGAAARSRRPATVLSTIGSSVSTTRPKIAGGAPMPSTVMAMREDRERRDGGAEIDDLRDGAGVAAHARARQRRSRAARRRRSRARPRSPPAPGAAATDRRCRPSASRSRRERRAPAAGRRARTRRRGPRSARRAASVPAMLTRSA